MSFLSKLGSKLRNAAEEATSTKGLRAIGSVGAALVTGNPYVGTTAYQLTGGNLKKDFGLPGWTNAALTAGNIYGGVSGETFAGMGDVFGGAESATPAFGLNPEASSINLGGEFQPSTELGKSALGSNLPSLESLSVNGGGGSGAHGAGEFNSAADEVGSHVSGNLSELQKVDGTKTKGLFDALTSSNFLTPAILAGTQLLGGVLAGKQQDKMAKQQRAQAKEDLLTQLKLEAIKRQYLGGGGGGGGGGGRNTSALYQQWAQSNNQARQGQEQALQSLGTVAQKAYLG